MTILKMMKLLSFFYVLLFISFLGEARADTGEKKSVYIVYTGAATSSRDTHIQLLSSLVGKESTEDRLVRVYSHAFSGCAVWLTEAEAEEISRRSDVVSVFADPIYQLHTTRSWDFLQNDLETYSNPRLNSDTLSDGADTIIGILDTGVWPESESFNDKDMGPIPSRWKGRCMEGSDFKPSKCNKKLIGARYYNQSFDDEDMDGDQTARDAVGHGTHTASTAAGTSVLGASYYGLAEGTAKGGSPGSRIAIYRVCSSSGCRGSAILSAFEDAIKDGVDVLSLSLGASAFLKPDFSKDPIAIGSFHAVENGITVVCSAGNDGPTPSSVVNSAPWILTVAATTIDRDFESDIILGDNNVIKGEGIHFSNLKKSPIYPLIYGKSAKSNSRRSDDARNCHPNALDGNKIKGNIVICDHQDDSYSKKGIREGIKGLGGIGLILIDDLESSVASSSGDFPMAMVSSKEATKILSYINSTTSPVATIPAAVSVNKYKPAPTVPYFSSRGPSSLTKAILKPDISAPGVNILAAWLQNNDTENVPSGQKPTLFNLLSGTSMSCPHVSGIAATVISMNPSWSPSAVKSAIMTTAAETNNQKLPITTDSGSVATPYDYGAGEVNPTGALQPGLVYETSANDYFGFLCNYGYDVRTIKLISSKVPSGFECPENSTKDSISQLNYPSIAISQLTAKGSKTVTRMVTNVGAEVEIKYTVSVDSPPGVNVKVIPETLEFTETSSKLKYDVVFSASSASSLQKDSDSFGSLTWTSGKYRVRSPFVVSNS
ncbi:hypothetical protein ACHQM5_024594 [Ranunculus cassubicifolius]